MSDSGSDMTADYRHGNHFWPDGLNFHSSSLDARANLEIVTQPDIVITDGGARLIGRDGTELVNMRNTSQTVKKIDRTTKWGNPYKLQKDGGEYTRQESVLKYREYIYGEIEEGRCDLDELAGETLGCWCLPKLCHGIVLLNMLARRDRAQS